jgi:transposase
LGPLHLDRPRAAAADHDPGKNRRRTIFGAIDLAASGRFHYQVTRKAISATFTAFCQQLLAAYPTAPLVAVVCDNVIIHRSQLVQRWLATHPRIVVLHGARYSPHDNPVERVWGALKAWLANNPTLTIRGRVRQVHAFFRQRAPAQLLATAAPHSSPWLPERTPVSDTGGGLRRAPRWRLPDAAVDFPRR